MGADYQAITNLKQIVVESNISFKSWSAGKITSPVTVWTVCIWKKVISLQFPCLISFVKSIQIKRWCGVESIHTAILKEKT